MTALATRACTHALDRLQRLKLVGTGVKLYRRGCPGSQGSERDVRLSVTTRSIPWLRGFVEGVVVGGKLEN